MIDFNKDNIEQVSPPLITPQVNSFQLDDRPSDIITVIILILLGVLGVYHVGSNYKQPSVYNISPSPYQSDLSQFTVFSSNPSVSKESNFEGQLIIDGNTVALQKLTFNISNYDANVQYTLVLGNGQVLHPDSKSIEYLYTESGSYLVELMASYKDQKTTLYSEFVDITDKLMMNDERLMIKERSL